MKIGLDKKRGRFLLSLNPGSNDDPVIELFYYVYKEAQRKGMCVPPPIDFSSLEKFRSAEIDDVCVALEYGHLKFAIFFLETLFEGLKEKGIDLPQVGVLLDEIKNWCAQDKEPESKTIN